MPDRNSILLEALLKNITYACEQGWDVSLVLCVRFPRQDAEQELTVIRTPQAAIARDQLMSLLERIQTLEQTEEWCANQTQRLMDIYETTQVSEAEEVVDPWDGDLPASMLTAASSVAELQDKESTPLKKNPFERLEDTRESAPLPKLIEASQVVDGPDED